MKGWTVGRMDGGMNANTFLWILLVAIDLQREVARYHQISKGLDDVHKGRTDIVDVLESDSQ